MLAAEEGRRPAVRGGGGLVAGRGLLQSNLLPYCAAALHLDNTIQRVDNDVTESGRDS